MNFFERQEETRRKTLQLIFLFIMADIGVVLSVYFVVMVAMQYYVNGAEASTLPKQWMDPLVLCWVFAVVQALILGGSLVKIIALGRGGQYVAESLGGRLVNPSTTDPLEKRFVNIVEEMAIASGVPVPMVYVLDNEDGINAFAAGYKPDDAAVAVTRGCLEKLTRDELQGVVGHEFSHILNGDMRLNIRLIGLISGIMILATIGYHILRSGGRSKKGGGPVMFMGLALIVIGYVGVFFSRIIQSAVSRQREYLADASSVQFTRNPAGLANALKKIGGFSKGSLVKSPLAPEASHMFFGNAVRSFFATHPPLVDRIRRIDPSFTGDFAATFQGEGVMAAGDAAVMDFSEPGKRMPMDVDRVKSMIGSVSPDHVDYSAKLLEEIPPEVRKELADPFGASAVVFALLLDGDALQKKNQVENLRKMVPDDIIRHILMIDKAVAGIDRRFRLPMADLSMPSLRRMSKVQFEKFNECLRVLIESDKRLNLFEFCLQQIVTHRLSASFAGAAESIRPERIETLLDDAVALISKLAELGHTDTADSQKAFETSVAKLSRYGAVRKTEIDSTVSFKDLGSAISNIAAAKPGIKEVVFDACAGCVLFDGRMNIEESELLRAIAYCLDLPMAPFLMKTA
ncbi:MAG: M48 family metalloprotease [Desulfobacterales bacterium]|jgi:Zn-dependent protease with chaperone function|nr:M48 family metalloprotease [Desulfobacterales bacterium]